MQLEQRPQCPGPSSESPHVRREQPSSCLSEPQDSASGRSQEERKDWERLKPLYEQWLRGEHPDWSEEQIKQAIEKGEPSDHAHRAFRKLFDSSDDEAEEKNSQKPL